MRSPSHPVRHRRPPTLLLAALSAAVVAACGGGGSSSPGATGGTVTPATLTVSGVAAVGAAMPNAAISASCATGSGSATALADGSYSLAITGGVLPCVLKATSSDGTTNLYSLAAGSGSSVTSNITPLTQLVVAQLTGQDPAAFYVSASADAASLATTLTVEKIDAASTAIVQTLQAAGVDTTGLTSIVAGSLSAGSGTGYDGVLDTLGSTLQSTGSSLAELTTTVAAASPAAAPATSTSGSEAAAANMLPADLLLRPKAADCAALRSGDYRFIVLKASSTTGATDPVDTLDLGTMDVNAAGGPTWTFASGGSGVLTPVAGEACHYTTSDASGGTADVVIAPSGIAVARTSMTWDPVAGARDANMRMAIALPVQTLAVADLAGTWNGFGWAAQAGALSQIDPGIVTLASDGSGSTSCSNNDPSTPDSACASDGTSTVMSANAAGGFDFTVTSPAATAKMRAFAYRAGNGQTLLVGLLADGSAYLLTPRRTLTAPSVGDAFKSWNVALDGSNVAFDAVAFNGFEVTATDAAAGTFTRTVTALVTGVSHAQTLAVNSARNGWIHRAAATAAGSDGSSVTVREMYSLKLGAGLSAYWLPGSNANGTNVRFGLSVVQP